MAGASRFLDVSVRLAAGMPVYPGNPEFELQPIKRIAQGGSSNISRLILGTHTGTHVDAPKQVGVDYLSVEQFKKPGAPAHHALLTRNVVIIEGLNLSSVEAGVYKLYCLPLPMVGGDGARASC